MITCQHCGHENPPGASFCEACNKPVAEGLDPTTVGTRAYTKSTGGHDDLPLALELAEGTLFANRYTIGPMLGRGGMGVVYRAVDTLAPGGRAIALKLIRPDRLADKDALDQLIREGMTTQDIRHPGVVAVHHVGVEEGMPFLAMELVEGSSLRRWLTSLITSQSEPPLPVVVAIMHNLLDAVEAAHAMGIIHRDLKPENVILTQRPSAEAAPLKVLDFGIASATTRDLPSTGTGMGSYGYMAPEQSNTAVPAQPTADIYSLSVMLYELLMTAVPAGVWQPVSGGRGDVPEAIDRLILDGMASPAHKRPASIAAFRERFDAALGELESSPGEEDDEQEDITLPPPPQPPQDKRIDKRVLIGGGIGVLALAAVAMSEIEDGPYEPPEPPVYSDSPLPPPSPPPQQLSLSAYSGSWYGDDGGGFDVAVNDNGLFSGSGQSADGTPLQISGNLANGTYMVGPRTGNPMLDVQQFSGIIGQFTLGDCDLEYTTYYPDGSVNVSGIMHIGHAPGERTCPARFSQ
ncbi:serine/threonine-protein kinase [Aurantiacibacter flavus]|uniref:Serine/threonine-protein kinase n=1 Tax=Aurantiacibacter flavus TaxID=3145232 RepID=A0ABV0CS34_9SPHN